MTTCAGREGPRGLAGAVLEPVGGGKPWGGKEVTHWKGLGGRGGKQILLFCPPFFNCGRRCIRVVVLSVQFSGIRYIHTVAQPSPPPPPELLILSN